MADSDADRTGPEETSSQGSHTAPEDLASLRRLLVGPEQEQLRALQTRLDDPKTYARDVSQILPEAIALRGHDGSLTKALAPSIEQAINTSVRRNPRPLADALFPVMGPAIRKAISYALGAMIESLNKTLEQSLSWKSLRWRVEAWRSGKSFSEVVLLHTLLYRVEHIFLIQRSSGLLLTHVSAPSAAVQDPDMMSSMMTVVRDFVRDSVGASDQESVEEMKIGELFFWAEQGPQAMLVALVRGRAPQEFHRSLQDALESIHLQYPEELESLSGDVKVFESARPILEACLEMRYQAGSRASSFRGVWISAAVLILFLGIWGFFIVRDQIRWDRYLNRIRNEPGIIVVSTGSKGGKFTIVGLRDPLASNPDSFIASSGLSPEKVDARWELYQALDPRFVLRRAHQMLDPPSSVTLSFENGVLTASGSASLRWIHESRRLALLVPGVVRYQEGRLEDAELRELEEEIEATNLEFAKGTSRLLGGQEHVLAGLVKRIGRLAEIAQGSGFNIRLRITGHADSDGSPEVNDSLSNARAEVVRSRLPSRDLQALEAVVAGVGSSHPLTTGTTEEDKQKNRRVSFTVVVPGNSSERSRQR
jgi:OOP family OmpA-OmpF porin